MGFPSKSREELPKPRKESGPLRKRTPKPWKPGTRPKIPGNRTGDPKRSGFKVQPVKSNLGNRRPETRSTKGNFGLTSPRGNTSAWHGKKLMENEYTQEKVKRTKGINGLQDYSKYFCLCICIYIVKHTHTCIHTDTHIGKI